MASVEYEGDPWEQPDSIPQLDKCPADGCTETKVVVQECSPGRTWIASCDKGHFATIYRKDIVEGKQP